MRYLLVIFLSFTPSLFALVSIAPVDIGSNPGFSGNVSGALSSKSGNTEKEDYALGLRIQYDEGNNYLVWGRLTYNYGTSNGVKNEDRTFGHLRTILAIDHEDWCGEFFIQSEQNKFKDINERSLVGTDLRWRFFNSDTWGKGYFGLGGLVETIDYAHTTLNPTETNVRLNSYVAYTKGFVNGSKLSYVGYYQPKIDQSSDYVSSNTIELIVPVYGKLNLSLTGQYAYDSHPPIGVKPEDTAFRTSLVWDF